MGRILATLATMLILLLAAAFAVPAFVDWNSYRSAIEKTASGVLGRKVSILGDIGIELLPEPHLRANNVAAGNGRSGGALMTAAAVDVSLSLEALFSGRLDAGSLRLVHPALTLDFSKPFAEQDAPEDSALPFAAGLRNVEIEAGRVSVFSRKGGSTEALALTEVNGTVSAASPGNTFRFNGRVSKNGHPYDVKLLASPHDGGLKLDGTATDTASRAVLHADGLLNAGTDPYFEGALALNVPESVPGANRLLFSLQAKSAARIGLLDAKLNELELILDQQNRPQVLTGSATIVFATGTASAVLRGRALDAGVLFTGPLPVDDHASLPYENGSWGSLGAAAHSLLWLYPDYALNLDLAADQVQLRGELIEGVKLHGKRTANRWLFDEALATLPGDAAVKMAGTLTKPAPAQEPTVTASVAVEGKSLGRLARWVIPSAVAGGRLPLGAFSIKGSLTLSPEVSAFEGVTGRLDGTPFTGGLHFDKAPARRLQVSLAGDNFDLSTFEIGENDAVSPADGLKAAWRAGLARLAAIFGGGEERLDTADVEISAGGIKFAATEAKNVAVHVKYGGDLLTVSKLSAETVNGLTLKAEGSVPLGAAGQGRFGGRLEARSAEAVVQAAALAGFETGGLERRAADMAPAALSISYDADTPGSATARLDGNLGQARVEGRAQLKGSLSDWDGTELSAQLKLNEPDGNKLAGLFFPKAALPAGAAPTPGVLSISLNGVPKQLQTQASLTTGALQIQLDGAAGLKPLSFKGKATASSQTPEQFLPGPLLAFLGGEPKASLRVSANLTAGPARFDASELTAETPGNIAAGHLAIDAGNVTRIDADLKSDKASLASMLTYFLSATPGDSIASVLPASLTAAPPPPDIWSGRPFSLAAFRETEGTISLSAKTMKLSDTLALTGATLHATLGQGRLNIETLSGKALGGTLDAVLSLTAKDNAIAAQAGLALAGVELSALANPGTAALVTGQASLSLKASGQGLSPRGLISVLRGRGAIRLTGGQLSRLTPYAVQTRADDLLAQALPLTEDAITKSALEAVQSKDFKFHKLIIPVTVADGTLDIRRASFRDGDATVRMEAYIDLNKALVDSTWQMGVSSDRRMKWPPVKIVLAGPLRELGARPRTLAADDFVRALQVRKMEGDISRLESLNRPAGAAPAKAPAAAGLNPPASWTATQQPAAAKKPKRKKEETPAAKAPEPAPPKTFEQRMHDALDNMGGTAAR